VDATNGRDSPRFSSLLDAIKTLFEGKLRSVLMCQECGNKRVQSEPFMSISLPLSKEVQKATNEMPGESNEHAGRVKVSVERCLRHFTIPEMLADPVDCPSCGIKTPTQKQHVVSKLPRVLCLHLKRFDAAQNKKIEDFVSFPAKGLNMGPHLPHWYVITTQDCMERVILLFD
jgi:ubiquitin C-terminal hydrolase